MTARPNARRRGLCGVLCLAGLWAPHLAWGQSGGSYEAFFTAIIRDHTQPIQRLLGRGFDVNTISPQLQPPLVMALQLESYEVAKLLLQQPTLAVDALNPQGENALMLAALKGELGLLDQLLARGAQVNKPGWTPLHYAAAHSGNPAIPMVRRLLERHAYIDAASPNGTTPLMMAAQYGLQDVVALLLQEGADPVLRNQQGLNAIDFARRADRPAVADLIARGARTRLPQGGW